MQSKKIALLTLLAALIPLEGYACGDSMYRVGKGVSYRVYTAPLPGSVLVYGESEGARQLAEALAQSGHGVRHVDSEQALASELTSGAYDVVIAPYSEHGAVEASAGVAGKARATFLPVVGTRNEAKSLGEVYDQDKVMIADQHEIKHYLKAIHKALKTRS